VCLSLYLKYYPFHGYFAIFQMKIKSQILTHKMINIQINSINARKK